MPVYKRRKAQVQAVQACWSVVFEGLTAISDVQLRKWWPWATKAAPGRESQFLVRLLLEVGHRDIQAPTGYVSQCLHVQTGMPYCAKAAGFGAVPRKAWSQGDLGEVSGTCDVDG